MTHRWRLSLPVLLSALVVGVALAAPVMARASTSDTLAWSRGYSGPSDYTDGSGNAVQVSGAFDAVSMPDAAHAWAVGARVVNATPQGGGTKSSLIAFSSDAGWSWTSLDLSGTAELQAVDAVESGRVVAVGENGTVAVFNGSAWAVQAVAGWSGKSLRGVAFANGGMTGWAVGDGCGAMYTPDGGSTWNPIAAPSGTKCLRAVAAIDETHAVAVGDGGAVWTLTATGVAARDSVTSNRLSGVTFTDAVHGWAVGDNATFITTTDGGRSWTTVRGIHLPLGRSTAVGLNVHAVTFADPRNGVAVGTYQTVWRTSDYGATWDPQTLDDGRSGTSGGLDLCGAAFAPGAWGAPAVVARGYSSSPDSRAYLQYAPLEDRAWAFAGTWQQPPVPPAAPTHVVASDGGVRGRHIRLDWTDASFDEDGFIIERSKDATGGPFTWVATVGTDATSWTDSTVDWTSRWYYRVKSYRGALYSAYAVSAGYAVDPDPPVTTADDGSGLGLQPAYDASATITLAADDGSGGSGVAHTRYVLDAADPAGVEGTRVHVTGVGDHTLDYWSLDAAGNVEPRNHAVFKVVAPGIVDSEVPTTTSDAVAVYSGSAHITLTATDDVGVAHTYHVLDHGATGVGASVDVAGEGVHTLEFWSVDLSGHGESTRTATFLIDTTPPVTTGVVSAVYTGSATINLGAVDHGSGVANTYYVLDGAARRPGTKVDASGARSHTLEYWSVDKAGNQEPHTTVGFSIVLPTATLTMPYAPSSIRHASVWTCYGYLKPRHTSGTYAVTLYFDRYERQHNGRYLWILRKSTKSKVANYSSYSKYSARVSVPYAGKWRVHAYHADGGHRASSSGYHSFTAR